MDGRRSIARAPGRVRRAAPPGFLVAGESPGEQSGRVPDRVPGRAVGVNGEDRADRTGESAEDIRTPPDRRPAGAGTMTHDVPAPRRTGARR